MVKILGVDPGVHMGIALFDTEDDLVSNVNRRDEQTWQVEGEGWRREVQMCEFVLQLIAEHGVDVLAMEDFILLKYESKERSGLSPVRQAAMVDALMSSAYGVLYGEESSVIRLGGVMRNFNMPGMAKGAWTDERLKAAGLWVGLSTHQRDAWRHALLVAKSAGLLRK